jgi:hypothetical protein
MLRNKEGGNKDLYGRRHIRAAGRGGSMTDNGTAAPDAVSSTSLVNGWDAAFCPDPVPTVINGLRMSYAGFYLGGSSAYHVWSDSERRRLNASGLRALPIWVPTPGSDNPRQVGLAAAAAMGAVSIPNHATPWRVLMWDLETGVQPDPSWLNIAADTLASRGYGSLVYGSPGGSGLFSYASRTGYVVASFDGNATLYPHANVVGKQYQANVSVSGGSVDLDVLQSGTLAHLGGVS